MIEEGSRVQIAAWTDRWMRGDRYGVVVKRPFQGGRPVMLGTWFVKLDKSGETVGFGVDALTLVDPLPELAPSASDGYECCASGRCEVCRPSPRGWL